ncbi:MAG TPA: M24 family metallopeptidase [Planctomycetes bacterium]|nr:M24 family metallopeptidase [Planctomycetota bacterium]HIK82425.1 M24 family metallopeptidase [Planctomycetota bacterium]
MKNEGRVKGEICGRWMEDHVVVHTPQTSRGRRRSSGDSEGGLFRLFPHGTSHHMGLDVHDVGPFRKFQKGMVVTVEAGISIPQEGFGIRIEDRAAATAEGWRVLPVALPEDLESMESAIREWVSERSRSLAPSHLKTSPGQ